MVVVTVIRSPGGLNCRCRLLLAIIIHHHFLPPLITVPLWDFQFGKFCTGCCCFRCFLLPPPPLMSSLPLPAPTEDGEESGILTVVVVIGTCRGKM
ncbi:hypothetical protein VTJ04DRAFT_2272 [Mycothermus thermophilus]|uniref:uncharacterized protein n=1 Tax=Humicola insolens TaxID=85995 RepID=UPI0037425477